MGVVQIHFIKGRMGKLGIITGQLSNPLKHTE